MSVTSTLLARPSFMRLPLTTAFKAKAPWPDPRSSIGESLCSMGRHRCWEAVGAAGDIAKGSLFKDIRVLLQSRHEYLSEGVSEGRILSFGVYMIGRNEDCARPTIVFSCENKTQRQRAMKLVRQSEILLEHPAIQLADSIRPLILTKPPVRLFDQERIQNADLRANLEQLVFCETPLDNLTGVRIFISQFDGEKTAAKQRTATVGGFITMGQDLYGLTVAHVFLNNCEDSELPQDEDLEFSLEYNSSDEEYEEDEEDDNAEQNLVSITSGGSVSPETLPLEHSESSSSTDHSSLSLKVQVKRDRSPPAQAVPNTMTQQTRDQLDRKSKDSIPLGRLAAMSPRKGAPDLDWALLRIEDIDLISKISHGDDTQLSVPDDRPLNVVSEAMPAKCEVIAVTGSNGMTQGTTLGNPIFMQMPGNSHFQEMWTVRLQGPLSHGDCGSWIFTADKRSLIGHIVAGDPEASVAYIVPAFQILADIEQRFGAKVSLLRRLEPILLRQSEPSSPVPETVNTSKGEGGFGPLILSHIRESKEVKIPQLPFYETGTTTDKPTKPYIAYPNYVSAESNFSWGKTRTETPAIMNFGTGFGDIETMAAVCGKIYKHGFSRAYHAGSQYLEFGKHILGLEMNLIDLQKIISTISQCKNARHRRSVDSSYRDALIGILGDYGRIVQDCEQYLSQRGLFIQQNHFADGIRWNVDISGEMRHLKDRVAFMNIKLTNFLKMLDLKPADQLNSNLLRVHEDINMRFASAEDTILVAFQKATDETVTKIQDPATVAAARRSTAYPDIFDPPNELKILFQLQLQLSPTGSTAGQFPLNRGLDAVAFHISTSKAISHTDVDWRDRQWLAIAKALWIITRVKGAEEYKHACLLRPESLFESWMKQSGLSVARYVQRLGIELLEMVGSTDFNSASLHIDSLIERFKQYPDMWFKPSEIIEPTPLAAMKMDHGENIMNADLKGPFRDFDQTLHLYKQTEVDLELMITDTPHPGTIGAIKNTIISVDMRRSGFVPLYAAINDPSSTAGTLNVTFQRNRQASESLAFVFSKKIDLFKFQHAITGYKVVNEAIGIRLATFTTAKFLGGSKSEYSGRIQLWRHKKLQSIASENPSNSIITSRSTIASSWPSSTTSSDMMFLAQSSPVSPASSTFASSPAQDSIFSQNMGNSRGSVMTAATTSTGLSMFSVGLNSQRGSNRTMITAGTPDLRGTTSSWQSAPFDRNSTVSGFIEPEPSLMVFLVQVESRKSVSRNTYASIAIEIDDSTIIDQSACNCRQTPNSCLRIVISRKSKNLKSFRQDAEHLKDWNLAALGKDQRKSLGDQKERLAWVAIDFGTIVDKIAFEEMFMMVKILWQREKVGYDRLSRIRMRQLEA